MNNLFGPFRPPGPGKTAVAAIDRINEGTTFAKRHQEPLNTLPVLAQNHPVKIDDVSAKVKLGQGLNLLYDITHRITVRDVLFSEDLAVYIDLVDKSPDVRFETDVLFSEVTTGDITEDIDGRIFDDFLKRSVSLRKLKSQTY